jgi:hypothetical protein
MRLMLIHVDQKTRLVDAETGEPIEGLVAAAFERLGYQDNARLSVTVNDFEAEIEVGSGQETDKRAKDRAARLEQLAALDEAVIVEPRATAKGDGTEPFSEAERHTRFDAIDRIMFFASRIAGSPVACDKEKGGAYVTKDLLALADRLQQVDARTPKGG